MDNNSRLTAVVLTAAILAVAAVAVTQLTGDVEDTPEFTGSGDRVVDGVVYSEDGKVIKGFTDGFGGVLTIDSSVERVAPHAADGSSLLTEVVIKGAGVTLGDGCFDGCSKLVSVKIDGSRVVVEGDVFSDSKRLERIEVTRSDIELRGGAVNNCKNLERIEFTDCDVKLCTDAITSCKNLICLGLNRCDAKLDSRCMWDCKTSWYSALHSEIHMMYDSFPDMRVAIFGDTDNKVFVTMKDGRVVEFGNGKVLGPDGSVV